jgi:hypothetical protein
MTTTRLTKQSAALAHACVNDINDDSCIRNDVGIITYVSLLVYYWCSRTVLQQGKHAE